ncbi:unnamed protein product [Oppiella nova]|uniref:Uncharacterized protein n=1 Tax=Oppiella nova TaxID=334625 RepID=A0A7R9QT32_9ACAR|nr:unnamed protein product [Oppiella nova]CAG2174672.1 unnamed protein product [Oppiella nova]
MPQDVYDKYKISSRYLNDQDRRDFWQKFANWWQNVFAQIGNFFQRVGKFIQNLFSGNKNRNQQTVTTTTPPPPTPAPQLLNKDNAKLVCVEYAENSDGGRTTRIYELDLTPTHKAITDLLTTLSASSAPVTNPTTTTVSEDNRMDVTKGGVERHDSTPFEAGLDKEKQEKHQLVPGIDQKANQGVAKDHRNDDTVVKTD